MRYRAMITLAAAALAGCATEARVTGDPVRVDLVTERGVITLELATDKAPLTVANFLHYVDEGALDGGSFYRTTRPGNDPLITVIQGGLWAPWEADMDEGFAPPFPPIAHETTELSGLSHGDGVISMARSEPGTASSEFFINVGANPSLDYGGERNPDGQGFAAFGKVIGGMDVVNAIHAAQAQPGEGFEGQIFVEPVKINSVRREQ